MKRTLLYEAETIDHERDGQNCHLELVYKLEDGHDLDDPEYSQLETHVVKVLVRYDLSYRSQSAASLDRWDGSWWKRVAWLHYLDLGKTPTGARCDWNWHRPGLSNGLIRMTMDLDVEELLRRAELIFTHGRL